MKLAPVEIVTNGERKVLEGYFKQLPQNYFPRPRAKKVKTTKLVHAGPCWGWTQAR